jgi:DNA-binding response OmpR family regulator
LYDILLVEDDQDLSLIAQTNLAHAGHQVDTAFTCAEARSCLAKKEYDLILLDEMLPDCSGDELCRSIRENCVCPIIFMSCLEDTDTIIRALHSGGDDYMVKPICYPELLARAEAIIRRSRQNRVPSTIRNFHSFTMDTTHRRILKGKTEVDLSSIEYALLRYMVERPDTLLLYQDLYQNVWETDSLGDFRTVMVHISNIRKKIDPEHRGIIETVRGAGYIFSDV